MLVIIIRINNSTQGAKGPLRRMLNSHTRPRRLREGIWVDYWRLYNSNIPLGSPPFRSQPSFPYPNNPDPHPCKSRKSHLSLGFPLKGSSKNSNDGRFHKPWDSPSQMLSLDNGSTLCTACLPTPNQLSPEKAMAPHSSTFAWRIQWMEEPGGLRSMGSLRVRHNWEIELNWKSNPQVL